MALGIAHAAHQHRAAAEQEGQALFPRRLDAVEECFLRISQPVLPNLLMNRRGRGLGRFPPAGVSPGHLSPALGCEEAPVRLIPPVAKIQHRHPRFVGQLIEHVFGGPNAHQHLAAVLLLPLTDHIEPEACERGRAGVLLAEHVHHVGIAAQFVEALADVSAVEVAAQWIGQVVEGVGHRHSIRQLSGLKAVDRPPREVHVVRVRLQQSMLHVEGVKQDGSLAVTERGKGLQPIKVPGVVLGQVVLGQSVPGLAGAGAGPGLLEKGGEGIRILPADGVMPIAPTVVPQAEVVLEPRIGIAEHVVGQLVQVLGAVRPGDHRVATGDVGALPGAPPRIVLGIAPDDPAVTDEPAVLQLELRIPCRAARRSVRRCGPGRGGRGALLQHHLFQHHCAGHIPTRGRPLQRPLAASGDRLTRFGLAGDHVVPGDLVRSGRAAEVELPFTARFQVEAVGQAGLGQAEPALGGGQQLVVGLHLGEGQRLNETAGPVQVVPQELQAFEGQALVALGKARVEVQLAAAPAQEHGVEVLGPEPPANGVVDRVDSRRLVNHDRERTARGLAGLAIGRHDGVEIG